MRSKVLWMTDLGLVNMGSGELSPGLDDIKLRFYPRFGFGVDEWNFEVGILEGLNPVFYLYKDSFSYEGNYFNLDIKFLELHQSSRICIYGTFKPTGQREIIWEGEILPNKFLIESKTIGLSTQSWNIIDEIKNTYPNYNPKHCASPVIEIKVNSFSIIATHAGSIEEHNEKNTPLTFIGFHPEQEFDLKVYGHLLGYGGMGGDAGISTVTEDIDIIYPTDALAGGNLVYVEFETQKLQVYVDHGASYIPGYGGKGATAFLINCPERRINQIGHPGVGGYPNGLNGKMTDIGYRLKLVKETLNPTIKVFDKCNYSFNPPKIVGHQLMQNMPSNTSIAGTGDGKRGELTPKGVTKLVNNGTSSEISNLIYVDDGYVLS